MALLERIPKVIRRLSCSPRGFSSESPEKNRLLISRGRRAYSDQPDKIRQGLDLPLFMSKGATESIEIALLSTRDPFAWFA